MWGDKMHKFKEIGVEKMGNKDYLIVECMRCGVRQEVELEDVSLDENES